MPELYKTFSAALGAVVLTGSAFLGGVYLAQSAPQTLPAAVADAPQAPLVTLDPAHIEAAAAVLYDVHTDRVLYQKNAYEPLPLASLTKLMAVETILSVQSPDAPVAIETAHLRPEGDSGLIPGEVYSLRDLISLALVASSNDAVTAAAASLGEDPIAQMNDAAHSLGLTQTQFYNATGLDIDAQTSGAYGSAYDVARLASIFYKHHPTFFELTTKPEVQVSGSGGTLSGVATMAPLQSIPGFVAAKTGYTELAGGNLVAVFDLQPGVTVVGAVLGSSRAGRFTDMQTLLAAARAAL